MDANNWRPTAPGGEALIDQGDWRTQLQPDSRQRIVNKIMDTLKRHLPFSGQEGVQELKKIAVRFEEKIYTAATSQPDYLRKISLKMLTMENKSQNTIPNPLPANPAGNSSKLPDPGASHSMQSQVHNQGQALPVPLPGNQSQAHQQLLPQNLQNNIATTGVQGSAGLASALPPVSGITQSTMASIVGQNNNMQNMSGMAQNSVGNSMGQMVPSNVFSNAQRQMPGRQPVGPQQQQQQQPQNSQYLYQQQLQQQLMKPKFQQPLLSSHIQQQQQPNNLLQPNQLQSSQHANVQSSSVMQPSMMQSAGIPQNQPSSVQQSTSSMLQHQQSVSRQQQQQQAALSHQQQSQMMKQQLLPSQQQLMGQQPNASIQQNQLIGQQNAIGEMQQQQRLLGQQNNLQNLQQQQLQQQQQHQQQQQQLLMAQQNNLSTMHQSQLGPQNTVVLQQQQQLLGSQSGNPSLPANQHAVQILQSKGPTQQQSQQTGTNLLAPGQQSQSQQSQQQLMPQMQAPPTQLQQQVGLQPQPNPTQRDLHQRLQVPGQGAGSLLQSQSLIDQQKQLYQSQRPLSDTSSSSLDTTAQIGQINGTDWQEEVYQKVKQMKETYLTELSEMYQKVAAKLQQHDSLPQQPKSDQFEKLKLFKSMVERMISVVQMTKSNITPGFKEKLPYYEKQIQNFLNSNRPRKPVSSMQQGVPQPHMQSMQQTHSQAPLVQSLENHMNTSMQSMNLPSAGSTMPHNSMSSMQHNSLPPMAGVSTAQQNIMNQLQSGSNMDAGLGGPLASLQQVAVGSLQQNAVSNSQQSGISSLSSQSGVSMLQPNITIQSNMLQQQQHLKQQEPMLQAQQLKQQIHQRQIQQQYVQKQQQQQQQQQQQHLHQQSKQLLPTQMQTQQIAQLNQINDANEMKIRQGMGVKTGVFQQHPSTGQRTSYSHQQMKSVSTFPISSPQLLQAASPQLPQHSSPQVDQQNVLSSLTKTGTPLQSANSPFVVPSPPTPMAPSPMPGDSEKPSLSNVGNIGHQQTTQAAAPSPAIGTPGISASPLLAEFTGPDGTHGALTTVSGKSSITEQPLEQLLKAVKSVSPKTLSAAVSDIGSVVSMIDRIAGSAPGNGSRAAVGEDLVAMTKCRLQARNCVTQDGMNGTRKMKRYTSAMPLNVVSSVGSISDGFRQLTGPDTSDLESTATSRVKRPRIEANHVLMEEIRQINQRLIDTVVDINDEDVDPTTAAAAAEGGEGTIVKCSFNAVSLSPNLKLQYASAQLSPIQPLRLLVPANYPNCSPILLDKFPVEVRKEYEDLSAKAKSRFSISLRSLSQPMSLGEIARTWDVCARAIISEHAQQSGGGTFSSKYGTWENCLSAT